MFFINFDKIRVIRPFVIFVMKKCTVVNWQIVNVTGQSSARAAGLCPACGVQNRAGVRFCEECGASL
jgi:hypothetical protein